MDNNTNSDAALSESLERALRRALRIEQSHHDASHDVYHARRVKQNALAIAKQEGSDEHTILIASAYLHDIVNIPKNAPNRDQASRLSAQAARPILSKLGFSEANSDAVAHCIEAHSFSANIKPNSLEARILQDADRLESLGALGIARTFYIAAKLNSDLFDGNDPFATARPLDDKKFALDHFKVKLLTLADTMKTDAGKAIAEKRTASMRNFLNALADEIGSTQPW